MSKEAIPIGIDIGTTFSCVGVWQNGHVEIITNDQGNRKTPSYVAFNNEQFFIGDAAKNQVIMNPHNTIFGVKRLIGRKYTDPMVKNDCKLWPFKVIARHDDIPEIQVKYKNEIKKFRAEEVMAMFLYKMKEIAQAYIGDKEVKKAVVTVPIHFNNLQHQSIRDAGKIAGLDVIYVLNASTAAAIAYNFDKKVYYEHKILIFDLGGGTCNVSILTLEDGIVEVMAISGNMHLGGEDFNERLVYHFAKEFERKYGYNLLNDVKAVRRLNKACEMAKRTLSVNNKANIELDVLFEGIDFISSITRTKFEELNMDLFRKCIEPVVKCLNDAKMDNSSLDSVVLIGGSTRIPKIRQMLKDFFNGKELCNSINPDEADTYGAAIQAAILGGDCNEKIQNTILLDVIPISLGLETHGGVMTVLIPRNTTIPIKKEQAFPTEKGIKLHFPIRIFEGEKSYAKDNNLLVEFESTAILATLKVEPQISITFDIVANHDMNVIMENKVTESKIKVAIRNEKGRLTEEEIERMTQEIEKYIAGNKAYETKIVAMNVLKKYAYNMRYRIKDEKFVKNLKYMLEKTIDDAIEFVESTEIAEIEEIGDKMKELESIYNPIMALINQASEKTDNIPYMNDDAERVSKQPPIEKLINKLNFKN